MLTDTQINRLAQYLYEEDVLKVTAMTDKAVVVSALKRGLERVEQADDEEPLLVCIACWTPITPGQPRFKAWTTDERGNTLTREYVHLYHVTNTLED